MTREISLSRNRGNRNCLDITVAGIVYPVGSEVSLMWRVVLAGIVLCVSATLAQRPVDFGQQWARSHPFQIMGVQQWPQTFDVPDYQAATMSSTLVRCADGNGAVEWRRDFPSSAE
jgi:hypothetical protein